MKIQSERITEIIKKINSEYNVEPTDENQGDCLCAKHGFELLISELKKGIPKESTCPDCNGRGEITTSHEFKHCNMCNGSGKVKNVF